MEKPLEPLPTARPPDNVQPKITKHGDVWTYTDAATILVSSGKADKEYMERQLKTWNERNKI